MSDTHTIRYRIWLVLIIPMTVHEIALSIGETDRRTSQTLNDMMQDGYARCLHTGHRPYRWERIPGRQPSAERKAPIRAEREQKPRTDTLRWEVPALEQAWPERRAKEAQCG